MKIDISESLMTELKTIKANLLKRLGELETELDGCEKDIEYMETALQALETLINYQEVPTPDTHTGAAEKGE